MSQNDGYTDRLRVIPIDTFIQRITPHIEELIRRYGHKKCGLIYRELCKDISEYIPKEKKSILSGKNQSVRNQFDLQWSNMKKNFLDKIFKDNGFENPCSSSKFKYNKDLYPLRKKYVNFCKELEEHKYKIQENNDFDKCVLYNKWIDTERAQFYHEYLPKVNLFTSKIVGEYLSPMQNDKTFNPATIYLKNKTNCSEIKRQQQELQRKRDVTLHTSQQNRRKPIARQESTKDGRNPSTKSVLEKEKKTVQTPVREPPKLTKENSKDQGLPKQAHKPTHKDPPQHITPPQIQQPDPPVVVHPVHKSPGQVPNTSTTSAPTTSAPTTSAPTTSAPTTSAPTTPAPTTSTTSAPTTSTTSAPTTSTTSDQDTAKNGVMSTTEGSSVSNSEYPNSASSLNQPKASPSVVDTQQISAQLPTLPNGNNDSFPKAKSDTVTSSEPKNSTQAQDGLLLKGTQGTSGHISSTLITRSDSNPSETLNQISQNMNTPLLHHPTIISAVPTFKESAASVNIATAKTGTPSKNDSAVRYNKNDNSNITPERLPPLINIIPTTLIILTSITVLFLLHKYTLLGLFLGRRKKRKKRDLQRIFVIPKEPTYESPNITLWEWEDPNFVGKTMENDVYIKLLKINRYKQELQKRKKKNKTTLIEVHMEVLEEYKNNEWELHKGDFLEICLRGFVNEENDFYSNFNNSDLSISYKKNEKTIEYIQKQEILWNNWIENHRNILEQWKKEEWFHILKNKWRNEEQKYKEKNDKLQENILNEQEKHSIVSQKDIWRQWISKQATFIDKFNKEDWFKSMVDEQNKKKENYSVNKYNENTIVTDINVSVREKSYHESYRKKKIIEKLMVQMHIIVLEECIKEDIIKNKEICIDNYIKDINGENKYEEK